jgi:hypothetical protein
MWEWITGRKRIATLERQVDTLQRVFDATIANIREEFISNDARATEIETRFDRMIGELSKNVDRQEIDFVTKNDLGNAIVRELEDHCRLASLVDAISQYDAQRADIERTVGRIEAKLGLLQEENDKRVSALLERLDRHLHR